MTTHGMRRLLAIVCLLPALGAAAVKETVTTDASGTAPTRDEAIAAALSQAVRKVQGTSVPADMLSALFLKSMRDERRMRPNTMEDMRIRSTVISPAVAFVQDYQVQESRREDNGKHWLARVSAEVVDPKARLANRQEKLVLSLLPFQFMQEEEAEVGGMDAQAESKQTMEDLARFKTLLTRKFDSQPRVAIGTLPAANEQAYENAAETPSQVNWSALSDLTHANNFITVQVEQFRLQPVKLKGGITTGRLDGGFTLHYRMIHNDGGQATILTSGTFTVDTRHPAIQPIAMTTSDAPADPVALRVRTNAVYEKVADLFARTLLADLVPPDVVAREGDNVLLQNGAGTLRKGEQLAVLGPDVTAPDPGTGLLLRQDGMRIAMLEVSSVDDGRIVARVVKGNAFGVQPGCLLRRIGFNVVGKRFHPPLPTEDDFSAIATRKR